MQANSLMTPFLVHEETDQRFPLPLAAEHIYLGKKNEDIPIHVELSALANSDIISRIHAVIHVQEGDYYLEDAGSLNGTLLNGEIVKPGVRFRKKLNNGDIITLGRNRTVDLRFELTDKK